MMKPAPIAVEDLDFQFKLQCKLKVFDNEDYAVFNQSYNLIAASSRYGLVFVGSSGPNFHVLQIETLETLNAKGEITDYAKRTINIPGRATHLAVNCDGTKLLVIVQQNQNTQGIVYNVESFLKQNLQIVNSLQLSSGSIPIKDILWNPENAVSFAYFKQDGTLGIIDLSKTDASSHLYKNVGASCICWSPKGKQIVLGISSGELKQFKPDLKEAKVIKAPPLEERSIPIALYWISNYKFLAVYQQLGENGVAYFVMVDAPKVGEVVYTNYEDVCYSFGTKRPPQFFFSMQPIWNILFSASANSMEVAVLRGKEEEWVALALGDSARAELPLSASKNETLPIGLGFDTSSTQPVPWGEGELPPAPYLFLLSSHGLLCCFKVINLKGQPICKPPEALTDKSGLPLFVATSSKPAATNPGIPNQNTFTNITSNHPSQQPTAFKAPETSGAPNLFGQSNIFTAKPPPVIPTVNSPQPPVSLFKQGQSPALGTNPLSQLGASLLAQTGIGASTAPSFNPSVPPPSVTTIPTDSGLQQTPSLFLPQKQPPQVQPLQPQIRQPVIQQPIVQQPQVQQLQPTKSPVVRENKPKSEDNNALFEQKIREECINLERDLKILLHKAKSLNISLGTDSELTEMVQNTNSLQEFFDEITETTSGQAAEVQALKQGILQAWAWYEEARSRFSIFKDPTLMAILRAQPLDPASEKQVADIKHLLYYLETQLNQAHNTLDEQWNDFQDSCKKSLRIKLPTMEAIYQSMVCQNATLQKQIYIMKDIQNRMKKIRRTQPRLPLLVKLENTEDLEDELKKLQLETVDVVDLQYDKVFQRQKKLTNKKIEKLTQLLQKRDVSHVSVTKPQISSTSLDLSNLLAAPLSPIITKPKSTAVQKLDFTQSTPKPKVIDLKTQNIPGVSIETKTTAGFLPSATLANKPEVPGSILGQTFNNLQPANIQPKSNIPIISNLTSKQPISNMQASSNIQAVKPIATVTSSDGFNFKLLSSSGAFVSTTTNIVTVATVNVTTTTKVITAAVPSAFASTAANISPFGLVKPSTNLFASTANQMPASSSILSGFSTKPVSTVAANVSNTTSPSTVSVSPVSNVITTSTSSGFSFKFPAVQSTGLTITPVSTTSSSGFTFTLPIAKSSTTTSETVSPTAKTPEITRPSSFATSPTNPTGNIFASSPQPSLFGALKTTEANKTPLFGNIAQPSAFKGSLFGQSGGGAVSSGGSIFGLTVTTVATSTVPTKPPTNLFVSTSTTSAPSASPTSASPSPTPSLAEEACETPTSSEVVAKTTVSSTTGSIFGNSLFSKPATPAFEIFSSPTTSVSSATTAVTSSESTAAVFGSNPKATDSLPTPQTTVSPFKAKIPILASTITTTSITTPVISPTSTPSSAPPTAAVSPLLATPTTSQTTVGSIFGTSTTSPSVFGTSATSIFGNTVTTSTPTTTSVLSTQSTTSTIFGTSTATNLFGTSVSSAPIFGATSSATPVYGATSTTTPAFGATSTTTPGFGSTSTTTPAFATPSTTPAFGATTTTASVFGTSVTTTPAFSTPSTNTSVFGTPVSTTTPSIFGTAASSPAFGTSTAAPSAFGSSTATQSPFGTAPVFGTAATSASTFGQTNTSTLGAGFGATTTTTSSGFRSVFGGATAFGSKSAGFGAATTTSGSLFGSSADFGAKPLFGTTTSSSANIFGSPTSTSSAFAPAQTSPFAPTTSTGFGSSTPSNSFSFAAAAANVPAFGGSAPNSGGTFGFGGLSTGTPTTSSSGFGSSTFGQAQNPFGRAAGQDQSSFSGGSLFGNTTPKSSGGSIFGTPTTTSSSSLFGNTNTSAPFGSKPAFGSSAFTSSSGFGQPSTFGQSSNFGSGSSFGNTPSSPGPFSGGNQNVAQTGFGGAFSSPSSGFGSPPAFGSSSAGFGAAPTFGSAPVFGSPTGFGSPGKVFGSPVAAESFGAVGQQQNSTFASLANQPTLGFGSLAQQTQNPSSSNSGFSGGSSFSTWR